ncbi:MAG: hypothetical protein ACJ77M_11525 [Thermoleophilaceae bacterium]
MATKLALLAVLALALIAPSSALAAGDFYVKDGGTGVACTQLDPCASLGTAVSLANVAGGNVHVIGPYTDHIGAVVMPDVNLLGSGSGPGGTFLDVSGGALALNMVGNATVDGVRLRSDSSTVAMQAGGSIANSAIETTSTALSPVNVGPGSTTLAVRLQRDTVTAPTAGTGTAVLISPGGFSTVIQDSALTGATGVSTIFGSPGASLVMQRSTINASSSGLSLSGIDAFVSSSVIHMTGADSKAVNMTSSIIGGTTTAELIEDTIDGSDTSGSSIGVSAGGGSFSFTSAAQATVADSIVRGFATDLLAHASTSPISLTPPPAGQITVARSDIGTRTAEPAPTASPPGSSAPGVITDSGGNLNVDPAFVNRGGGDYSLRTGSALIDAAGTASIGNNESATDRGGRDRVLDGDGNGTAARDMGAFEYVFRVVDTGPGAQTTTPASPQIVQEPKPAAFAFKLSGAGTLLLYPPNLLKLPVSCAAGSPSACVFQVVVRTTGPVVTTSRAKKKKGKVLTLGRGHATIAVGKSGTIKVKLSKAALELFKKGKLRGVSVVAHLGNAASAKSVKKTYKLKAAPKKKKKRKH